MAGPSDCDDSPSDLLFGNWELFSLISGECLTHYEGDLPFMC